MRSRARRWVTALSISAVATSAAVACSAPAPKPIGCGTATSASSTSTAAVAIIGDSLSSGFATPGYPWTKPAQAMLDAAKVSAQLANSSAAGAGYVACGDGNRNFADLLRLAVNGHTSVVLFFGSDNDLGAANYPTVVRDTLALARRLAPHATVVVVGPPATPTNPPAELTGIRDSLEAGVRAAGAQFVDALDWFSGVDAEYVGPDGEHPNMAGEDYLARKMTPIIESALHVRPAPA